MAGWMRTAFVCVMFLCGCESQSARDAGLDAGSLGDAGMDAGASAAGVDAGSSTCVPAPPSLEPSGSYGCVPLDAGDCEQLSAAQAVVACTSVTSYVDHATCGAIELWRIRGHFTSLECIYEDGGLIGLRQNSDALVSSANYVAGRWQANCQPDGRPACGRCEPSDGGPLGCLALSLSSCGASPAAQATNTCLSAIRKHGVCGSTEIWEDSNPPYFFRRCVYEDGGLVGALEQTNDRREWWANYTAGQWETSCVAVDAGCL